MKRLLPLIALASSVALVTQAIDSQKVLGISPELVVKYSGNVFECFDGSRTIPISAVNDDYCDCPGDGSDEPGTSACENGKFYCENEGHLSAWIPSSRVNDGICDEACCDGTDENSGAVKCPNLCSAAAEEFRRVNEEENRIKQEGSRLKNEYIQSFKSASTIRKSTLENLKTRLELKRLEVKEKERLKKDAATLMTKASLSHKGKMQKNCYSKLSSTKKSLKGLRSSIDQLETHIHSLADRLEGETAKTDGEWRSAITDFVNFYSELGFTKFRELPILDDASLQEEEEEENGHLNYYDETDEAAVPKEEHESVWTEFISTYYKGCVAPIVDFFGIWKESQKTPLVHSKEALDRATKALEGVEREIIETEREVENIERKSGIDYGALGEFFGLDDQCFESEGSGEYIYEICPFKEAKQKKADTKALVASLGSWSGWVQEDKYKIMRFTNGAQCWNGPQRTMQVNMKCGTENKVISVWEPNKCEYEMEMTTPAVCEQ